MTDIDWLKILVKAFVLPPAGPFLLSLVGLTLKSRFPGTGRTLAWAGMILLFALSMPVVAYLLLQCAGSPPPFFPSHAHNAQAIVILGGGIRRDAPEYEGDTLGRLTLDRVRYGARLARVTGLPVLVTGGSVLESRPEGELMRESLEREFGVPVRWVETRSRNTRDNAVLSAKILRADAVARVVLVAHGFDMRRAVAEFAAAGIEAIPAATGISSGGSLSLADFLPTIGGLQGSYYATYEILADFLRSIVSAH
ncbi:MAG: YdcF family protein [Betaproteobacteria bacterium]|nr:YdcF family protein [Betaproteobacteria bacterium]